MVALYREWNERINVVSRKDIDALYEHHILHSLAIAEYLRRYYPAEYRAWAPDRDSDYPAIPLEGVQGVKGVSPAMRSCAGESAPGHALFLSGIRY